MTMNFSDPTVAKQNIEWNNSGYSIDFQMSNNDYNAISGAKVGNKIDYRWGSNKSVDISRLAFAYNSTATTSTTDGNGFYLYGERSGSWYRGLFTGQHGTRLAVLNLKPGDKVTFSYIGSSVSGNDANLHNDTNNYWFTQISSWQTASATVDINFVGDLIVSVNRGTIIQSITIESEVAEYDITTNGNTTTFEFTKNGTLEENDFALPYMSFSMGSINDYLVVQGNQEVHMYKPTGGEAMETNGWPNFIPITGSFYEFKPTGGGIVTMEGSLTGTVHLFVFDPTNNTWVQKQNDGVFHKLNFPDTYNQNPQEGSDFYDANYSFTNNNGYVSFSFTVEKDKYYYVCIDKNNSTEVNSNYAFHMHKMSFTNSFHLAELAKIIDLTNVSDGSWIELTSITGYNSYNIHTKRCSGNITPPASEDYMIQNNFLYMKKPTFADGTDNAGTVVIDVKTNGGDAVFVATFPYHADYNPTGYTDTNRTYGHTWNFIDPRNSDTNIGNCWINNGWDSFSKGTTSGILSIGQDKNTNSQFHIEVQNREWTYSQRQTGQSGGFHDPYYVNVWDMVGDNADMIWETEGLWFDTGTNLSCIYNENDAVDQSKTNPLDFISPGSTDPDRYVGLLPVTDDKKSSFTIPGLKDGDRVLIFMKSGEGSGANGIFLNITGAKDALGNPISKTDLYKAGGTNWQHNRYEGCYHFIKDGDGNMTFDMQSGSMCKLLYIRIYQGKRIDTNDIVSTKYIPDGVDDNGKPKYKTETGKLLFVNDKGATEGDYSTLSLRFRGKGQKSTNRILTYSGNLKASSFTGNNFVVEGDYNQLIQFKSTVGEIGMFRLRFTDVEYSENYVADFTDRNFTVGYRDKVDSYPYTWDLTDIMNTSYSTAADVTKDATVYKEVDLTTYPNENTGWDISLFDTDGYMKVNSGVDPAAENQIFSSDKNGFGNQLWAYGGAIPEARGLWFYQDDNKTNEDDSNEGNDPKYNDCIQITSDGLCFVNKNLADGSHDPWWNFKMVVPDVPADGAVYLRMKRDSRIKETDKKYSDKAGKNVLFLNTRFAWGTGSKTSLTEDNTESVYLTQENGTAYSFFEVPGTSDEYILAVKNTGEMNHLQLTLNGWIVKKVAVSPEEDYKKVNVKGWTTESRNHVVDPELTAYMTGVDFETCLVTGVNYADKTVTLTRMGNTQVMTKLIDGEKGANIIHNKANEEAKVLAGGFHLFVPDMHDYNMTNDANGVKAKTDKTSLLIAQVTNSNGAKVIPASSGDYTNYALTYKYYKLDANGNKTGKIIEGDEAFYRIANGGASSSGNQGYLPLETKYVDPSSSSYGTNPSNDSNGAKFSIIFEDEFEDINPGITTTIGDIESSERVVTTEGFYNLNGQKMNGIPTQKGMYIVNGKKVLVK